jgi:hypothetical protein
LTNGGSCGTTLETRGCAMHECDLDCAVSDWGS